MSPCKLLDAARLASGLSRTALAQRLGVTPQRISQMERSGRLADVERLAGAMGYRFALVPEAPERLALDAPAERRRLPLLDFAA